MKKLLVILLFLACTSYGIESNIAGLIWKVLEPNKIYHFCMPFEIDKPIVIDQLPEGTKINMWDSRKMMYASELKDVIEQGDAFFIQTPDDEIPFKFALYGTVSTTTFTQNIERAFNQVGYPFPVAINFTNTSLYTVTNKFTINIWDADKQKYTGLRKQDDLDYVIKIGEGFWILSKDRFEWAEDAPY